MKKISQYLLLWKHSEVFELKRKTIKQSSLYVSEKIMNIFNLELKKQMIEIKNFAKSTNILIDENLGYNNFYIE